MVINIETTGIKPWESRLIGIGFLDIRMPDMEPFVLIDLDERKILLEFLKIFKQGNYKKLIGYNLSFDFRFIIAKAMTYQIGCNEFKEAELIDVMRAVQYGKTEYVFGSPPSGKLTEWCQYFFNFPKEITDAQMLRAWEEGRTDIVRDFAANQVLRCYELWKLWTVTTESSTPLGVLSGEAQLTSPLTIPEAHLPETWTASCPFCLSERDVSSEQKEIICPICRTLIKRV